MVYDFSFYHSSIKKDIPNIHPYLMITINIK